LLALSPARGVEATSLLGDCGLEVGDAALELRSKWGTLIRSACAPEEGDEEAEDADMFSRRQLSLTHTHTHTERETKQKNQSQRCRYFLFFSFWLVPQSTVTNFCPKK